MLEYSLLYISGYKFPVAVFAVDWWNVGIYGNLGLRDFIFRNTCRFQYMHEDGMLVQGHWPYHSAPGTCHPFLAIGSLH